MSVKRIYTCDICRDQEQEFSTTGKDVSLIGFEFKAGVGRLLIMKGSREVERHICKVCLRGLYNLAIEAGVTK